MKYLLLLLMITGCQTAVNIGIVDEYNTEELVFVSPVCISGLKDQGTDAAYYVAGATHMACSVYDMRPWHTEWITYGWWDCAHDEYHWKIQVTCIDREDYKEMLEK
jgi:hypothetical protein